MEKLKRLLLIEDNKNIALTERFCLETEGYQILLAGDGVTGLEIAINEKPDLILLDLLIPKMDGFLVLEALRSNPSVSDIPVLVTSAKAQVEDLEKAYTFKIDGYLIKPFTPNELINKVSQILSKLEKE